MLAALPQEHRVKALQILIAQSRLGDGASIEKQIKRVWEALPADQKQKLLGEALKLMQELTPEERSVLMKRFLALQEDEPAAPVAPQLVPAPAPEQPMQLQPVDADDPITRFKQQVDRFLLENGEGLSGALDSAANALNQLRETLEIYRALPDKQRAEMLDEIENGLWMILDENLLPELDLRIEGFRQAREVALEIYRVARDYNEAFRALPPNERDQIIEDLIETGKLLFEETVQPELERRARQLEEDLKAFARLPREARRQRYREMSEQLRRWFRR
jgi:hypothetical protein